MTTPHPTLSLLAVLALTVLPGTVSRAAASAQPDRRPVPDRLIITGVRFADPMPESVRVGRSRALPPLDAYGSRVAPGAPRFVTGSMIRQTFELYGSAANTASPLFIYTQGDLRSGGSGFLGGPYGQSFSDQGTRLASPRYTLDFRRIPPARRMAALTRLIGPERARQVMDEAYAALPIKR